MEENLPSGWVKPQRTRTLPELRELIATKREELSLLEAEAATLAEDERLHAIAQARNIMRAHQLSYEDIASR